MWRSKLQSMLHLIYSNNFKMYNIFNYLIVKVERIWNKNKVDAD